MFAEGKEVEDGGLTEGDSNKPAVNEGFPMKEWTVEIYVLDQDGKERPARCFTKAVYHLHPSFANPTQSMFLVCDNLDAGKARGS